MEKQVLINTQTLRDKTTIDNSITDNILNKLIIESQDLYLIDILGINLYNEIVDQLIKKNITDLNKTLLVDYIRNFLTYSVKYSLYSESSVKITTKGIIIPTSTDFETPESEMIQFQINSVKNKLERYKSRMIAYLHNNLDKYPLFKEYLEPKTEFTPNDFTNTILFDVTNNKRIW